MPDCQRRLEQAVAVNRKLASLQIAAPAAPGKLCPEDDEWMNVAAGLGNEGVSQQMLEHAANCDHCGPLLKEATAVLSDESSAEEKSS